MILARQLSQWTIGGESASFHNWHHINEDMMTDEQQDKRDDDGFSAQGWWGRLRMSSATLTRLLDHMGPALPWIAYAFAGSMVILSLFLGLSWVWK